MAGGAELEARTWGLTETAARYVDAALSPNTKDSYRHAWTTFVLWCERRGIPPLPAAPETVANYAAEAAGELATSTIARHIAAINKAHQVRGLPAPGSSPAVNAVMSGLRRTDARQVRRMRPLMRDDVRRIVAAMDFDTWPAGVAARRDTALIMFGFVGAFRRSELVALHISDVTWQATTGLLVKVRRQKNDQEGRGAVKAIPFGSRPDTCGVCAWVGWMQMLTAGSRPGRMRIVLAGGDGHVCRDEPARPDDGEQPLFVPVTKAGDVRVGRRLSGQAVHDVVRRRAASAGIGPAGFGSHSLRAGFITQALSAGATETAVARQTGHRSAASIGVYDREYVPLRGNAVTKLGL